MADWDAMLAEAKRLQKIEELARGVMGANNDNSYGSEGCFYCGDHNFDEHMNYCQSPDCCAFQLRELLKAGE